MSRLQNAGQYHEVWTSSKFVVIVTQFMYLGTPMTTLNNNHNEMNGRLNSENSCCRSV
jgi:hypothetical protein